MRYIITNLHRGRIEGTDDGKLAAQLAECEDFFVADTLEALWLQPGGVSVPITEAPPLSEDA